MNLDKGSVSPVENTMTRFFCSTLVMTFLVTAPAAALAQSTDVDEYYEQAGIQMEHGMKNEMSSTGVPGGLGTMLMNPPPDQPWLSANPRDMTSMYAMMLVDAEQSVPLLFKMDCTVTDGVRTSCGADRG